MPSKKKLAFFVVSSLIIFAPAISLAAANLVQIVPDDCNGRGGCQSVCDIAKLGQNLLNDGIYFAIVMSAIFFAWAGWQYMTAEGQPYKIKNAKTMLRNIAIGLALIVAAWLLVDTLLNILTGQTRLQWNRIC